MGQMIDAKLLLEAVLRQTMRSQGDTCHASHVQHNMTGTFKEETRVEEQETDRHY